MTQLSIPENEKNAIFETLKKANIAFQLEYPGDSADRQPVHTVYGGANLFTGDMSSKMGKVALTTLHDYAPDASTFAKVFNISESLAPTIYDKVVNKLEREPLEDFRIDFEDGFGNRSDEEEDQVAEKAAIEVAKGMESNILPPFIGIRIKPFSEDLKERGARTLDIFVSTLSALTGGKLPSNFVVMLPKVSIPEQVSSMVRLFELLESNTALSPGSLKMEIMVETTQSLMGSDGKNPLKALVLAGEGRCIATAFGTYDYTASCNITAVYQDMNHPVCDFAHHMTRVALGQTGIFLSDGATNVMPIGPHRADNLSAEQLQENTDVVHRAWKLSYDHIRHSLYNGFYQGWDLHPSQLPARYAAVYSFFLESYTEATDRLRNFMNAAARATLSGDIFDDAATGQGLLNYFLRGLNSGAISADEATATGLSIEEIELRSFYKILQKRKEKE